MEAHEARPLNPKIGQFILVDEEMDQASLHLTEAQAEEEVVDAAAESVFYIAKIVRVVRVKYPAPIMEDL